MRSVRFVKMDGLGNDFVIIDARKQSVELSAKDIIAMGNRKTGIGFDQLFVLEKSDKADVKMVIYNADSSIAGACGNGTRCVADILFKEGACGEIKLEAPDGKVLTAFNGSSITVNMGKPELGWDKIPLSREMDTLELPEILPGYCSPTAVSMGNPHVVFFVEDINKVNLEAEGPKVENNPLFPQRTNVEFAQVLDKGIRMRVWERGAGITMACGSGACATLVAYARKNLGPRKADIIMDGGTLTIEWTFAGDVLMTGPVNTAFKGEAYLK